MAKGMGMRMYRFGHVEFRVFIGHPRKARIVGIGQAGLWMAVDTRERAWSLYLATSFSPPLN